MKLVKHRTAVGHYSGNERMDPTKLDNDNYDRLLGLMIAIRHKRQGNKIITYKNDNGVLLCECPVPKMFQDIMPVSVVNIDKAREQIALFLTPLVKDKFISYLQRKVDMMEVRVNAMEREKKKNSLTR